jgi:hypothetical protein
MKKTILVSWVKQLLFGSFSEHFLLYFGGSFVVALSILKKSYRSLSEKGSLRV